MQRNDKTLLINTKQLIFLPGALKMLSKETSLDPNVAVGPERQLSSL